MNSVAAVEGMERIVRMPGHRNEQEFGADRGEGEGRGEKSR